MANQINTQRNIGDVIDRIQDQAPKGHPLRVRLVDLVQTIRYRAPEMGWVNWRDLMCILSEELPDPDLPDTPGWCKKIGRIVRGEEETNGNAN